MVRQFVFCLSLASITGVALAETRPAQSKSADRYFFYRATKGAAQFYFLGSMHMGKPDDPDYPDKIYAALAGSRFLVLEGEVRKEKIRTPDMRATYLPNGKSIRAFLTPREYAQLEHVATLLKIQLTPFERFQPWFMEFMFGYRMAFNEGFVLEYGSEHRLLRYAGKLAENSRPKVIVLEGADEVLRRMNALPLGDQIVRFRRFLSYSDSKRASNVVEMQRDWQAGNDDKVRKIFNYYANGDSAEGERFTQVLLYDRNRRMAERLDLISRYNGQYFVVTGALHLLGAKSILWHLQRSGFTIERL